MSRLVYNVALLLGVGLVSAGVGVEYGRAHGMIAAGGLVIALTFVGAWLEKI